jgi:hypothetical protein
VLSTSRSDSIPTAMLWDGMSQFIVRSQARATTVSRSSTRLFTNRELEQLQCPL